MKTDDFHIFQLTPKVENFQFHINWLAKHYLVAVQEEVQHSWLKDNRMIQLDQTTEVISFFERCCHDQQYFHVLLCQMGSKNIGYFFGLIKDNLAEIPKQTGYINGIYILAEYRKEGLGSLLLNEANKWFKAASITMIELNVTHNNSRADKFWMKHGYKPCETIYANVIL